MIDDVLEYIRKKNESDELLDWSSVDFLCRGLNSFETAENHLRKVECSESCNGVKKYLEGLEEESREFAGLLRDYVENWMKKEGLETYDAENTKDPDGYLMTILKSGKLAELDDEEPICKAHVALLCYLIKDSDFSDVFGAIPKEEPHEKD